MLVVCQMYGRYRQAVAAWEKVSRLPTELTVTVTAKVRERYLQHAADCVRSGQRDMLHPLYGERWVESNDELYLVTNDGLATRLPDLQIHMNDDEWRKRDCVRFEMKRLS